MTQNTVDEDIFNLGQRKRELTSAVLADDRGVGGGALDHSEDHKVKALRSVPCLPFDCDSSIFCSPETVYLPLRLYTYISILQQVDIGQILRNTLERYRES